MAAQLERLLEALGGVEVVLDDEDANAARLPPMLGSRQLQAPLGRQIQRQLESEERALPGPVALCAHGSAVQLDEPLDQRQPEAEPSAAAVECPVRLHEGLEEPGQELRLRSRLRRRALE